MEQVKESFARDVDANLKSALDDGLWVRTRFC